MPKNRFNKQIESRVVNQRLVIVAQSVPIFQENRVSILQVLLINHLQEELHSQDRYQDNSLVKLEHAPVLNQWADSLGEVNAKESQDHDQGDCVHKGAPYVVDHTEDQKEADQDD